MAEQKSGRYGLIRAAPAIALAGLVAACAWGPRNPAPVVLKGAPSVVAEPALEPARADARRIVVERGQSLSIIAHANHVSAQAIIAANHLTPPYKIETGQHLLIPGTAAAPMEPPLAAA